MRPQVLSAEEDRERNELLLMRAEDTRTRDLRLARNRAAERQQRKCMTSGTCWFLIHELLDDGHDVHTAAALLRKRSPLLRRRRRSAFAAAFLLAWPGRILLVKCNKRDSKTNAA